jgi:hypothetical protein
MKPSALARSNPKRGYYAEMPSTTTAGSPAASARASAFPIIATPLWDQRDVVDLLGLQPGNLPSWTLLELGADPTIRDALHGGSASGWARHGCHPELAERLS